jgi:hypothetical protein
VQEVVLAKDIDIVAGSRSLQWQTLKQAVEAIRALRHFSRSLSKLDVIIRLISSRTSFSKGHEIKLLEMLNRTVCLKATDSRDKIYGLLGLTSDSSSLIPSPDYSLPVDNVPKNATRAIAISETNLDNLSTKMWWDTPEAGRPRWYPNWDGLRKIPIWGI